MSKRIIGVIHLPALPGSPKHELPVDEIVKRAVRDAKALEGVDALIIENFGDTPFTPGTVEPQVVSVLTRVAMEVRQAANLPVGINVLRNDAVSALAVALAVGAEFVRVNVLTGVYAAGEGLLVGNAHEILRYRKRIGCSAHLFADVLVKHAQPLGPINVPQMARDTAYRGGADALVVTGTATGKEPDSETVQMIRNAVPDKPLYIGSGLTPENAGKLLRHADGAIVGTAFKAGGKVTNPVDRNRVRRLLEQIR